MPSRKPEQPSRKHDFLKRRSFAQGRKEVDDAHYATHRLYCDVFGFWRGCQSRMCKRHRHCIGKANICLARNLPKVPHWRHFMARKQVLAGGPRRLPPATHIEWTVRRCDLVQLMSWVFG